MNDENMMEQNHGLQSDACTGEDTRSRCACWAESVFLGKLDN